MDSMEIGYRLKALKALAWATRKIKFPGIERLVRLIYNPEMHPSDHLTFTIQYDRDMLMNVDLSSTLGWSLFFFGEDDPAVGSVLKKIFKPGFVAFDIGANIGCYTLIMSFLAKERGRVFAVEPVPRIFAKLEENIKLNRLKNIKTLPFALSDAKGKLAFYAPAESAVNQGEGSFYPQNVTHEKTEIRVEVRTLDEVIQAEECDRLDFLKIDTEGNECKVLHGSKESIRKYRPYIVFEYEERTWKNAGANFEVAKDFLLGMDYSLFVIKSNRLASIESGFPAFTNILAIPADDRMGGS